MKLLKKSITIILFILLFSSLSYARFTETYANVFQYKNQEYKIVLTQDGIFVAQTKKIPDDKFSKENLNNKEVIRHCFIKYDQEKNRYDSLLLGENTYIIEGGLNLTLGNMKIKIDDLNTYATFVVEDKNIPDSEQGILGIVGTTVVTNTTGSAFITFLEANAMKNNGENKIPTYTISTEEELLLDNKPIEYASNIGIKTNINKNLNICLNKNSVIIDNKTLEEIKKISLNKKNSQKSIEEIYLKNKSEDVIKDAIIMQIDENAVILLDYVDANIKIVKKLGETSSSNQTLCLIKNIEI